MIRYILYSTISLFLLSCNEKEAVEASCSSAGKKWNDESLDEGNTVIIDSECKTFLDECNVCGGTGILDGFCDCDGNVDLGCGCGEPASDENLDCDGNIIDLDVEDLIIGDWVYSKVLFNEKKKEFKQSAIDMSVGFKKIEMSFYGNGEYISYLNDQVTHGLWSIIDSLITFKPIGNRETTSEFECEDNNLYIYVPTDVYDGLYILAFKRK